MHLTTRFWRAGKKLNSETARGRNQREIQTDIPSISLVFISIDIYSYLYYYFEKKHKRTRMRFCGLKFCEKPNCESDQRTGKDLRTQNTSFSERERERGQPERKGIIMNA